MKNRFSAVHPQLKDKTVAIPNLIEYEKVLNLADAPLSVELGSDVFNLITVGRMEWEKRYDRLLEIAAELKKQNVKFHWYFVGDGTLLEDTKALCRDRELEKEITFTGALENPYPLMKACDLFVLLSEYEGTPVTIDEAKVLGLPVLANDVGGIADMLGNGLYGEILPDSLQYTQIPRLIMEIKTVSPFSEEKCKSYNQQTAYLLEKFYRN